jgi:hypothetical protein
MYPETQWAIHAGYQRIPCLMDIDGWMLMDINLPPAVAAVVAAAAGCRYHRHVLR